MNITIDIETVPTTDPYIIEQIRETVTHPPQMSKPETIAKWEEEKKPYEVQKAIDKTSLESDRGIIAVICMKVDDGSVESFVNPVPDKPWGGEKQLLEEFWNQIEVRLNKEKKPLRSVVWMGHNIARFDLMWLMHRSLINGISAARLHGFPYNTAPYDERIFDTMFQWCGLRDMISLDRLCYAFGIEKNSDLPEIDGSKVAEFWRRGEYDTVVEYCIDDVTREHKLACKMGATIKQEKSENE